MKGAIQQFARRMWRGDGGTAGVVLNVVLLPAEWLWRAAAARRNARFERRAPIAVSGLRVISVGNLAVGGTGKTPIASWVVRELRTLGARPAILHGGYGHDEPMLHARWTPDVPVIAERDRVEGARRALAEGAEVAVLDDGFQHRWIARDVDLVVLAAEDPFPGPLLPRGPYREPVASLARADGVIISRRTATDTEATDLADRVRSLMPSTPVLAGVRLEPGALRPLSPAVETPPTDGALVLTAVGRPDSVLDNVRRVVGGNVSLHAYADHHDYTAADVRDARQRAGGRSIVVTEKDAVKLERFASELGTCYVLEQTLGWDWGEDDVRSLLAVEDTVR